MNHTMSLVVIPSKTVREIFGKVLPDFGTAPEKNLAGITMNGTTYLPIDAIPDMLIVSDRELCKASRELIEDAMSQCRHIYVALHGESYSADYNYLKVLEQSCPKTVYRSFHRTESDPVFAALCEFLGCVSSNCPARDYSKDLERFLQSFSVDWDLEKEIARIHNHLDASNGLAIPDDTLVLWNANSFADTLREKSGEVSVATSPDELDRALKTKKKLLILSELTWDNRRASQFYGYELAQDLVTRHTDVNVAFVSAVSRQELKRHGAAARLMVPIFPHLSLPFAHQQTGEFRFPNFSPTKWRLIRNFFLRPDGIVDKLIHDLQKLKHGAERDRIIAFLQDIQTYSAILPADIVERAKITEELARKNLDSAIKRLRKLQIDLEEFLAHREFPDSPGKYAVPHPHRIMVVEDDPDTLDRLRRGLSAHFRTVVALESGAEAMQELRKNAFGYSAVLADMELLDQKGNWQEIQGYDLIEEAHKYPHLVVYMLTVFPPRAIGEILSTANLGDVHYQAKDVVHGLPPHVSYLEFSENLRKQILAKNRYLVGPKNGVWRKGLLHFYYQVKISDEGEKLWTSVQDCVNRLLEAGFDNSTAIVPKTLFHVDTRHFKLEQLTTVLCHRLLCLYCQYSEGGLHFENGIKKAIGFRVRSPKQYFNTLLGFSVVNRKSNDDETWLIQKRNLLPEEVTWLRQAFPEDQSLAFPQLINTLQDVIEWLPPTERNLENGRLTLNSLDDCILLFPILDRQSQKVIDDIAVDLRYYREHFSKELVLLQEDERGRTISDLILDLIDRANPEGSVQAV